MGQCITQVQHKQEWLNWIHPPTSAFIAGNFRKPVHGYLSWVPGDHEEGHGEGEALTDVVSIFIIHTKQITCDKCELPTLLLMLPSTFLDSCPPRLVDVCPGNANSFQCILFDGLEGIWDHAEPQGHGYEQQLLCWRFTDVLVTRGLWLIECWTTESLLYNGVGGSSPTAKYIISESQGIWRKTHKVEFFLYIYKKICFIPPN